MADKESLNRQKESIRLEEEYQKAMSFSAQIQRDINKEINIGVDARTKSGKAIREHNNELMKGMSSIKTSGDIAKKSTELEAENISLLRSKNQYNKEEVDRKIASNKFALEGLALDYERVSAAEKLDENAQKVTSGLTSQIDKIQQFGSNIPIVGGLFDSVFGGAFNNLKSEIGDAGKEMLVSFAKGGMSFKNLSAGFSKFGARILTALANPLVLAGIAVAAIVAAFVVGIARFKELDAAAKQFREETGLTNSQTMGMQKNIQAVNMEYAKLGVSAKDVSKAAADFTNEFDGLEQPSQAVLGSMVTLNKNFGIGTAEMAKMNKVFQNIGGLSAAQSQALIGQTAQMAKMAGVAPQRVMKDMADSSEYAYKYFKGSPQELAKAAVQAAKMGTSIAEAGKAADNLLDFQNSITSELEASAILGVNLDLSQARYAAANGDLIGQQQAINDQVAQLGDLTKLNTFEQDALAKATGMEFSSLVNQQRIRERFGKLNDEQLAAATSLVDAGKDINSLTAEDLENQTKKLKSQEDMQSAMDKLSNNTDALKTGFMDMFAPLGAYIIPVFNDIVEMISMQFMPLMKGIGSVFKIVYGIVGAIWNVLMMIVKPLFAIGSAITEALFTPLNRAADAMQPLFDKFAEMKDKVMVAIQPVIGVIQSIAGFLGDLVGGAVGTVIDIIIFLFDTAWTVFSSIGSFINTYLIEPIMAVIRAAKTAAKWLSFGILGGDDEEESGSTQTTAVGASDSINDGVVQAGKVVSTDPADFLIASKNPGGLAEAVGSGGGGGSVNISMDGVIAELQALKQAFMSNKDVYLDRELVSRQVSKGQEKSGRINDFGLSTT